MGGGKHGDQYCNWRRNNRLCHNRRGDYAVNGVGVYMLEAFFAGVTALGVVNKESIRDEIGTALTKIARWLAMSVGMAGAAG